MKDNMSVAKSLAYIKEFQEQRDNSKIKKLDKLPTKFSLPLKCPFCGSFDTQKLYDGWEEDETIFPDGHYCNVCRGEF